MCSGKSAPPVFLLVDLASPSPKIVASVVVFIYVDDDGNN